MRRMTRKKSQKPAPLLPLYQEAKNDSQVLGGNRGLVFNKWVDTWEQKGEEIILDKMRFVDQWKRCTIGNKVELQAYQQRMERLVEQQEGFLCHFTNIDPLISGMGLPHPLENGMVWHHTLGVPFIPGSSLKGILRSWMELNECREDQIDEIFGSEQGGVGAWIFFDLIPTAPVRLQPDVMTPHFASYYSEDTAPPDERSEPIPIPFLTIAPEQSFFWACVPRKDKQQPSLLQSLIDEAFSVLGLGSKTAVGYGRLQRMPR